MFATGRIVNLGCGEDPCDFGERAVHVDLDCYNHKNFVQADIHNLPFRDDEFDTAVLGDVLEHSPDPVKMLKEAGRVAKKVVATVFEEWRPPEDPAAQQEQKLRELHAMGFETTMDYIKSLPTHRDCIVSVMEDDVISHHPHLQMFTDESLKKTIEDAGLEPIVFKKYQEGATEERPFYNWLVVARKKTA
jgi:ubiquinone/menaquinone biosynthesis C-methylase UbiE